VSDLPRSARALRQAAGQIGTRSAPSATGGWWPFLQPSIGNAGR
jgi:hypothetical protein